MRHARHSPNYLGCTMAEIRFLGRRYHYVYGYPWRWAIPAEIMWRVEHGPVARGWGYRWRKTFERKGAASV